MSEHQSEQIGILKSIWRRDDAGRWVIHDLQRIDLRPRDGFTRDYFKIKDELALLTQRPGPIFDNLFASFGSTEFLLRQSIVPIVAWNDGDEQNSVRWHRLLHQRLGHFANCCPRSPRPY